MSALPWLLIPAGLVLAIGLAASFYVTNHKPRTAIHSPAEYGLQYEEVRFKTVDGV